MTGAHRVLIVGAGVTGLLTAVGCARAGHRVTVLERGRIPNTVSSSFDQHRAIRALDPSDMAATRTAAGLHRRWLELEALLGARFYRRVGVVSGWPRDEVDSVLAVAAAADVPAAVVDSATLRHVMFPVGHVGVREPDAGVLLADRVLRAAVRWLRGHPAVTLHPWREVVAVDTERTRIVLGDGTTMRGELLLLATAAWSRQLVDVPMVLRRQTTMYVRPPEDLVPWWEQAPSAGRIGVDGQSWLLPPGEGTLLKISSARVCREVSTLNEPDDERRWAAELSMSEILAQADRYAVAAVKQCHYTVDPRTGGAALEQIGPAVWARAAVGGDGFRTAPLVADRIVEQAAGGLAA